MNIDDLNLLAQLIESSGLAIEELEKAIESF